MVQVEVQAHTFLISALDGSSELLSLTAFSAREGVPGTHLIGAQTDRRDALESLGKRHISYFFQESNQQSSDDQRVAQSVYRLSHSTSHQMLCTYLAHGTRRSSEVFIIRRGFITHFILYVLRECQEK